MSTSRLLAESFAPVLDFIYPPRCPACGCGVGEQGGLCSTCWSDLVIPSEPCCAACQRPFGDHGPQAGAICAPCLADPPGHDGIAAGTLYTDTSRRLVLAFKHGRRIALAPLLLRKGEGEQQTKLALYGLGHLRDDVLNRALEKKELTVGRPTDDAEEWFSILAMHQNCL